MSELSVSELVQHVPNGARVAIPPSRSGVSLAATRALIDRKARNLHLIAIPTSGIQADMLIGAGCVAIMECAGVTLDEHGQAGRFVAAIKAGSISLRDSTCPALVSGLQAGEKGIPFMPMRGLIGSDLLKYRPDYQVIDNPMSDRPDPIVLLPAITPDIALFHAPMADSKGNVWIGPMRELMTMAHAARQTLVTVEEIIDTDLMRDELRAPATIPSLYITAIAHAPGGSWPLGLQGCHDPDNAELVRYAAASRDAESFASWLAQTQKRMVA